ncbi:MAG: HAD hydrolase family protein [Oligoflexia bacterium]|nr:HAD hydrolase family protein [Oligoflexia bacterium]MBF0364004.1 HAD hydrolase family protein [Oligoflexia bacterium]
MKTNNLHLLAQKFSKQLQPISVFLMDVDGILTNGIIYYSGNEIGFNRFFHAHDGYILKVLQSAGINVGVISGGDSIGLRKRVEILNLDPNFVFLGNEDKREAFIEVTKRAKCTSENILYMGDELFDIPLLKRAGFSATVPNASQEVKDAVDYVTFRSGGDGAVREVADILRYAKGIYPLVPDFADLKDLQDLKDLKDFNSDEHKTI